MEWTPRPLVEHLREQERHNVTVITVGSKYEVYVRSPAPSHMLTLEQPFRTLAIKWEVNIIVKKSSCVFPLASFITVSVIIASVCIQHIYVCNTFPKGICPKVNVIARLEYELAYYDSVVHHFNHYTTRTPPQTIEFSISVDFVYTQLNVQNSSVLNNSV